MINLIIPFRICITKMSSIYLSVNKDRPPLNSLDDLSESTEYFPMILYGSVQHSLFEVNKKAFYVLSQDNSIIVVE